MTPIAISREAFTGTATSRSAAELFTFHAATPGKMTVPIAKGDGNIGWGRYHNASVREALHDLTRQAFIDLIKSGTLGSIKLDRRYRSITGITGRLNLLEASPLAPYEAEWTDLYDTEGLYIDINKVAMRRKLSDSQIAQTFLSKKGDIAYELSIDTNYGNKNKGIDSYCRDTDYPTSGSSLRRFLAFLGSAILTEAISKDTDIKKSIFSLDKKIFLPQGWETSIEHRENKDGTYFTRIYLTNPNFTRPLTDIFPLDDPKTFGAWNAFVTHWGTPELLLAGGEVMMGAT